MGETKNAYRVSVGKLEGKSPLSRPRRKREDNIKMCLLEIGWGVWTEFIWLMIETSGGLL
jgi:hypothetical protein